MITKDNYVEMVRSISDKEKRIILESQDEYVYLTCHVFNVGYVATAKPVSDVFERQEDSAILDIEIVQEILTDELVELANA